jgi:nicotinate phosphoribosyltransferase
LDENGLDYVKILASGDLDEYKIQDLLRRGAKIDSFGVGTRMSTSEDRPYVDIIYKLCERMDKHGKFVPTMKLSRHKKTLPARKQVYRVSDRAGNYVKDIIALHDEKMEGTPLLVKVMEQGEITCELPTLVQIRENTSKNLARLPDKYKLLKGAPDYHVVCSPNMKKLLRNVTTQLKKIENSS